MNNQIFTYQGIAKVLAQLGKRHTLMQLREWEGNPGIILRHDVDLSVSMALGMAKVESSLGLTGTYFFLTTCPTYNVSSRQVRAQIQEIRRCGFEVGLHFDPTIYGEVDLETLASKAELERSILQDILGEKVVSLSLHNPSVSGNFVQIPGWLNAYDPAIFNPECYLSDSRMRFRSDPLDFFAARQDKVSQLLLHPLHYACDGQDYPEPMAQYIFDQLHDVDHLFSVNDRYAEMVASHPLAEAVLRRLS